MERLSIRYSWLDMHNSNQLDFSKFLIMESKNLMKSYNSFYLVRNVAELTVDSPMDTLQDIFADIRDSEEKAFDCRFLWAKLGYLVKKANVAMAKLMAKIQEGEEYIERLKKSHEELVNLEAKKKEKEQLNKEIQELMDRVKELDKDIQSNREVRVRVRCRNLSGSRSLIPGPLAYYEFASYEPMRDRANK
ncbi:hypothetical protein ACSBR1_013983 [Camellia fascicularis]